MNWTEITPEMKVKINDVFGLIFTHSGTEGITIYNNGESSFTPGEALTCLNILHDLMRGEKVMKVEENDL